jgi:hypothetical protein
VVQAVECQPHKCEAKPQYHEGGGGGGGGSLARAWWLKPIILATWEAEIRKSGFEARSSKKFERPLSQPKAEHSGVHLLSQLLRKARIAGLRSWSGPKVIPYVKNNQARCQWLMPIILATQEADFRRITVRS